MARAAPLIVMVAAVGAAHLLDPWGLGLHNPDARSHDWHRLLRVCGSLLTWLAVGLGLWLHDRSGRRAGMLVLSASLSGLAAEVLKVVLRRVRPVSVWEGYAFEPWAGEWWSTAGLGLPSSHAAVAFGAGWAMVRLSPRGGWVVLALAVGCGLTRVIDRAHFISDVVMAACVAWVVCVGLWSRWR
ncbi:MAG: membrane-associated phospholipid phosphatase [Myxococcota bacterium]